MVTNAFQRPTRMIQCNVFLETDSIQIWHMHSKRTMVIVSLEFGSKQSHEIRPCMQNPYSTTNITQFCIGSKESFKPRCGYTDWNGRKNKMAVPHDYGLFRLTIQKQTCSVLVLFSVIYLNASILDLQNKQSVIKFLTFHIIYLTNR